jgi:hypothetical protein
VSLNELRMALGVDAVLVVKTGSVDDGGKIWLTDVAMMLVGPNPIPRREGKRYVQYKEGQTYVDGVLKLKKPALVAKVKKSDISEENYDGFDTVIAAAADRFGSYLVTEINRE